MRTKTISLSAFCSLLAATAVACGKSEEPPAAVAPDDKAGAPSSAAEPEAGADAAEGASEAEATSEAQPDDAAGGDGEAADKPRRGPRDRLANRRPPPRDISRMGRGGDVAKGVANPAALGDGAGDEAGADAEPEGDAARAGGEARPDDNEAADESSPSAAPRDPPTPTEGKPEGEPKDSGIAPLDPRPAPPLVRPADVQRAAPPPPTPAKPVDPALDPARLLPLASVLEITTAKGLVDAGVLPGIATGGGYVSIHYRGPAADKFGVSLQAWQDPARREADDRFRRMRLQYPNAEDVQVLPAKAFFAQFGGIQMLTFVDSVKRVVVTVACSEAICSHDQLAKLAKVVRERL